VTINDSDSQVAEWVCAYSANPIATPVASVPAIEMKRETASRRTAARGE
jgi:hypothetical protein